MQDDTWDIQLDDLDNVLSIQKYKWHEKRGYSFLDRLEQCLGKVKGPDKCRNRLDLGRPCLETR